MAINITNSGGSIKLEVTSNYVRAGYDLVKAQTVFLSKADFDVKAGQESVTLRDETEVYRFHYSDITSPSGASAAAVAALIEAFVDSGSGTQAVTLPTGQHAITSSTASSSGSVTAGAVRVTMDTSATFSGTINGIARLASTSYEFVAETGKTLPSIAYVISAGSINIDKTV